MFFSYSQNNTGGSFVVDDNVAHYVVIEANNYREANSKAEDIGLYWDGCSDGTDCSCCGDRWYKLNKNNIGDPVPSLFGRPIEDSDIGGNFNKEVRLHLANGQVVKVSRTNKEMFTLKGKKT